MIEVYGGIMKKAITVLMLSTMTCLIGLKNINKSEPIISDLSIIIDYHDPAETESTAVLDETLKTMSSGCSHLFLNKKLWISCINDTYFAQLDANSKKDFCAQWNCYDTQKGLLYFSYKESINALGVKIDTFKRIDDPFNNDIITAIKDDFNWPTHFDALFDLQACVANHNNPESKIVVYMNGHGTPRIDNLAYELVCGISAPQFAHLLTFFNNTLHISLLGVQSCHWTAQRIKELMTKHAHVNQINFTILTPLSTEEGLWLDTIGNYMNKKNDGRSCFFDCCCDIADSEMTIADIKKLTYNTDTLKLPQNDTQKATVVTANSNELIVI